MGSPYIISAFLTLSLLSPALLADRQASDDESNIEDPRVQHRSYTFTPTGETLPYAIFIPDNYNESDQAPLVVSLHGLGRSYDWLMGYHGLLDEAADNGYIVVTPLGYIRRGWYGSRQTEDPDDGKYSEQDVMNVLNIVREEFNIDPNRIYLWGHSMGGAGTYHIAAANPQLFAALAVVAPAPLSSTSPDLLQAFSDVPILVIQGDQDDAVDVGQTREWVAKMRELGMQHVYVEVPGGDHSLIISQNTENMKRVTDFFNIVRKQY